MHDYKPADISYKIIQTENVSWYIRSDIRRQSLTAQGSEVVAQEEEEFL